MQMLEQFINRPLALRGQCLPMLVSSISSLQHPGYGVRSSYDDDDDDDDDDQMVEGVKVISVGGFLSKRPGPFGSSYSSLRGRIQRALADPSIRGLVLDVDSPGGEVGGLLDFCDFLVRERGGRKPIYSLADSAFSAAYCLASSTNRVYIPRHAGCGSVGISILHCDQSGFDQKAGLKFDYIHAGARKIDGKSHAPLATGVRAEMQAEMDRLSTLLCRTVGRGRNCLPARIADLQAGCLYGGACVPLLADRVGTKDDCIADMLGALGVHPRSKRFSPVFRAELKLAAMRPRPRNQVTVQEAARRLSVLRGTK
jgi:ClpP class serine protease